MGQNFDGYIFGTNNRSINFLDQRRQNRGDVTINKNKERTDLLLPLVFNFLMQGKRNRWSLMWTFCSHAVRNVMQVVETASRR